MKKDMRLTMIWLNALYSMFSLSALVISVFTDTSNTSVAGMFVFSLSQFFYSINTFILQIKEEGSKFPKSTMIFFFLGSIVSSSICFVLLIATGLPYKIRFYSLQVAFWLMMIAFLWNVFIAMKSSISFYKTNTTQPTQENTTTSQNNK